MAAIICKAFGDFCTGCTKICTLPCTLCCDTTANLCSNPFCLYVAVALGFNIPPIAMGIFAVAPAFSGCKASLWLLVDLIMCGVNIAAAIYVAAKYRQQNGESRGFDRAKDILCYDPAIAIYILVLIGYFAWLCVGLSWIASGQMYDGGMCADGVANLINSSIGLGFSFFGFGCMALFISLCCSCCMDGSGADDTIYQMPPNTNQQSNNQGTSAMFTKPSAPPAQDVENNTKYPTATAVPADINGSVPLTARVVEPSAPTREGDNFSLDKEAEAAASGAKIGIKLGTFVRADEQTKAKLQYAGAKANVAANKGLAAVKKMAGMSRG